MKQNNKSIILGVTGGIGSGKSTVSLILQELGAVIIDADEISRQIVMPGEEALLELIEAFGNTIVDSSGNLKRKMLADMVFSSTLQLEMLNSILHKYVAQRIKDSVEEHMQKEREVIVIDAPIPIKTGFLDLCDKVWTVHVDLEIRIARIMKRNGMTQEEAVSRISSQITEEEYLKIADTVIRNNDDINKLKQEVRYQLSILTGGTLEKEE